MKKAMILAAGFGERLRPLTYHCPKPLMAVGGKPLIEHHLERLARMQVEHVVINVCYLADMIMQYLGNGERFGLRIEYSVESDKPLGVLPGLRQARQWLGDGHFWLFSADVWAEVTALKMPALSADMSHFWLVDNPAYNAEGDFSLQGNQLQHGADFTFAGMAVLSAKALDASHQDFGGWVHDLILRGKAVGEKLPGKWFNVGSLAELNALRQLHGVMH